MKLFGLDIRWAKLASVPVDPAVDLISTLRNQLLSGTTSVAGAPVNDDSVMSLSAAFACMRVLSEDVAVTPVMLYRRLSDTARERANQLSRYRLLHDRPNPEMTAFTFKQFMMMQALLPSGGYACAEIEFNDYGYPVALWPLLSKDTAMKRDGVGQIYFEVTHANGEKTQLPAYKVLYVPGMTTTGYNGLSPATSAANVIGLTLALEKLASLHFANGGFVKDYLKTPNVLREDALKRLEESWTSGHGTLNTAQRTAILEHGLEYVAIVTELAKILPPEVRSQQVIEVARLYRMQPNKIGEYGRATWANAEQMQTSHYTDCLLPWFARWEQELNYKLLSIQEQQVYFYEFLADNWLKGDYETRVRGQATMIQNGIVTRNEVRAMWNLPPIEGGDEVFVPLNTAPISQVINGEVTPGAGSSPGGVAK